MVVGISLLLLAVLVVGLVVVLRMGRANAEDDSPPPSSDFIAPVSSGALRFRKADESPENFHDRLKHEDEEIASSKRNPNAP